MLAYYTMADKDLEIAKRVENYFLAMINVNVIDSEYSVWNNMVNSTYNLYKNGQLTYELINFGNSQITTGVNIHDYKFDSQHVIEYHENYHQQQLTSLTNIPLESLLVDKKFNIRGRTYKNDDNLCTPVTAYRLAYYVYKSLEYLDKNKRNVVLEIGGGFGLTSLIFNRNMKNSCYIILDIPSTGILSSYFLIQMGLKVCLYGEYNTEDYEDLINKYDVIIIHPNEIIKFKDNSIDIVINTASFVEMSDVWIEYYIKHISRITKIFYNDNHFCEGRPALDMYCNKYLNNFDIIYKTITPINYLIPIIQGNTLERPYEEVLRIKKI